ncbi:hypothetical protein NYO91_13725 [Arhodomonas aquaeolei]|uniref:hypothetical protein n=1 Tax=Arhodomonas aquaeolei TaxID=2369 RepID=UPI00216A33EF|nr:hypothetical protein [Arhodomonas aquaeolei]MCS4505141.1 hypothetical protein [Arhodomonas aquaeolei]
MPDEIRQHPLLGLELRAGGLVERAPPQDRAVVAPQLPPLVDFAGIGGEEFLPDFGGNFAPAERLRYALASPSSGSQTLFLSFLCRRLLPITPGTKITAIARSVHTTRVTWFSSLGRIQLSAWLGGV